MSSLILAPQVSPNEDTVTFVEWTRDAGQEIRHGDVICRVETTKAVFDVAAENDGYLAPLASPGDKVDVGSPIGAILDSAADRIEPLLAATAAEAEDARRWTAKAAIVARRLGVDLEALAAATGRVVTESDVLDAAEPEHADLLEGPSPAGRQERVLLIGGAAGAGAITLDAIAGTPTQRAVGILDANPVAHGRTVMGVPVLGPLDRIDELWAEGSFDGAIILFTQDVDERASVFEALRAKGIPFTNVIAPTAHLGAHVVLGTGNLIMGNVYLSTAVSLGDNNFLAAQTSIEHHSRIGSHCTFGPGTNLSGRVTVGDRVRFGMMVGVEPYLTVGSEAIVASGCVLTANVPERSTVKAHLDYVVRPRDDA